MTTTTETVPVSVWQFAPIPWSKGAGEFRSVVAVSSDEQWAVGSFVHVETGRSHAIVLRKTGDLRFVSPAAADFDVRLHGVDGAGEHVWAVGWISDGKDGGRPRIERYSRVADPVGVEVAGLAVDRNSALHGVAMLSPTEGWAVGGSGPGADADLTHTLIARWDGSTWRAVPSPNPGTTTNQLDAVTARASDDVWAVGHTTSKGPAQALVLHWDGKEWTQVPTPDLVGGIELLDVAVVSPSSVWAVGTSVPDQTVGTPWRQLAVILHWDGSAWKSLLPEQVVVTQMSGVTALSETNVWFAGYAKLPGGPENAHVEHWDGRQLHTEASGIATADELGTALEGICAVGNEVVAVGWHVPVVSPTPMQTPGVLIGHVGP